MVNVLCENALIAAYADRQSQVLADNVRRAAVEFDLAPGPYPAILRSLPGEAGFAGPLAAPPELETVPHPPALEAVPDAREPQAPAAEHRHATPPPAPR